MAPKVEQVTEPVLLGEGPHWDNEQQCLYFVSIFDHSIHKYVPSTGKTTKGKLCKWIYLNKVEILIHHKQLYILADNVGFIVPLSGTKDKFVVGLGRKVVTVQWDGENNSQVKEISLIAEIDKEPGFNTNRLNDGKADPRGRLLGG